jgi:hypothetical protein
VEIAGDDYGKAEPFHSSGGKAAIRRTAMLSTYAALLCCLLIMS